MRTIFQSSFAAFALALFTFAAPTEALFAQATVKINKIMVDTTQSPQFTLSGKKKPFKSKKNWLEAEVSFHVSAKRPPKDGYLPDALQVEVFVVVKSGREKKLIKHSGTYDNVAVGELQAVAVYLPPREFARLVGKARPTRSDVVGYAVNISYGGKSVASQLKSIPAEATKASPEMEMLPKSKTPFRDLYYDNYLVDSEG